MTESMIERVAKALHEEEWRDANRWDDTDEPDRQYWRNAARAAIEAMLQPTERMVESVMVGKGFVNNRDAVLRDWNKLIDAALIWPAGSADKAGVPMAGD